MHRYGAGQLDYRSAAYPYVPSPIFSSFLYCSLVPVPQRMEPLAFFPASAMVTE